MSPAASVSSHLRTCHAHVLTRTLWSRNMKESLQQAASLTPEELPSFSSASRLEFEIYTPLIQVEISGVGSCEGNFNFLPSVLNWNGCIDRAEKGTKGRGSEFGWRGFSRSYCGTPWELIMPIVFDSDWLLRRIFDRCGTHGKHLPFAVLGWMHLPAHPRAFKRYIFLCRVWIYVRASVGEGK